MINGDEAPNGRKNLADLIKETNFPHESVRLNRNRTATSNGFKKQITSMIYVKKSFLLNRDFLIVLILS